MRTRSRRAVGTIAITMPILIGADGPAAQAGQARAELSVTVAVIAACGATMEPGGTVSDAGGCPAGSAPLSILVQNETAPTSGSPPATSTAIEDHGDVRYVTVIY